MKDDFEHIKKRLRDYESPMQLDEVWGSMQALQQQRKGRRKRRLALLLLLLLLVSAGTYGLLQMQPSENAGVAGKMPVVTSPVSAEKAAQQSAGLSTSNGASKATTASVQPSEMPASIPHNKNTKPSKEEVIRTVNQFNTSNKQLLTNTLQQNKNNQQTNTSYTSNPLPIENTPTPSAESTRETHSNISVQEPVISENKTNEKLPEAAHVSPANIPTESTVWNIFALPVSAPAVAARPSVYALSLPNFPEKRTFETIQPVKKTPIRKTLTISSGALIAQQHFSDKMPETSGYAAIRQGKESSLPGFTTDLGIGIALSKKFTLEAGLRYDQWYDEFVHQYQQEKEYTLKNVLLGVVKYEPVGTEVKIFGDTTIVGMQTVRATFYNRYAATDVRLALSRTFWNYQRWSVDATVGASANVYRKIQGNILSPDPYTGVVAISEAKYKTTLGIGLYADVRLNYRLTSRFDLQLRPTMLYGLSDALQSDAPLSSRFRRSSVQLGLRTRF